MHVLIVYAHPSDDSFTRHVRDEFIKGLVDGNHTYEISDLYKMNFITDMSESEYLREANYRTDLSLPNDVYNEQQKINKSDSIVFIYPIFWTEAPAKLVGWFDRVWAYGFAYGERTMKTLYKALICCVAGHTEEYLRANGHYDSMKNVMLDDRINDRAKNKEFIILDGTSKFNQELRKANWGKHLQTAYNAGRYL